MNLVKETTENEHWQIRDIYWQKKLEVIMILVGKEITAEKKK